MPRRVLVVTPSLPAPPRFGGAVAWYQTLRALRRQGVPVTLISGLHAGADLDAFHRAAGEVCDAFHGFRAKQHLVRALHPTLPYSVRMLTPDAAEARALRDFCAARAADADVVLLEHPYVYEVYASVAPALPAPHALVLRSLNREAEFYAGFARDLPWTAPRRYLALAERFRVDRYERRVVDAADGVACVSDVEAAALGRDTAYWFPVCFFDGLPTLDLTGEDAQVHARLRAQIGNRRVLLLTSSFHGGHNLRAVRWFLEAVMPRLRERRKDVCLVVAGLRADRVVPSPPDDVLVVSNYPSVRPLMRLADASVVVTFGAAGVKVKLLEALYYRKPVVATRAGVVGSGLGAHVPQTDDPAELAALCDAALDGRIDYAPLWARYAELYDPERNARLLVDRLDGHLAGRRTAGPSPAPAHRALPAREPTSAP